MNKILFIDDNDRLYKFGSGNNDKFQSCFTETFKEVLNDKTGLQCDYLCFNERGQWQIFSDLNVTGRELDDSLKKSSKDMILKEYIKTYISDKEDSCVIFIDFAWENNVGINLDDVLKIMDEMPENKLKAIKKIYIYSARMPGEARDYVIAMAKNFTKIQNKMGSACFDRSDLYDSCDYFKQYFEKAFNELGVK